MPIYQRGKNKTWWIDITKPNGERIRQSSGTQNKQQAQELHDKMKAESWRVKNLGVNPRHTWQEAVIRWITEQSHKKSIEDDKRLLRWLHKHLADKPLEAINSGVVSEIILAKQLEGVKNATVNRVLAVLRSILNKAFKEWGWLETAPPFIKSFPEAKVRIRWLTELEAVRLLNELPEHLEAMARFTLATGLREANVYGLQWNQIDMQRRCAWIYGDQAKAGKDIAVPLNDDAIAVIVKQIGKHQSYVFTYQGKNVTGCNNHAWTKALKRAGIDNFRWHDLRHTWASWHIQNGTPPHILQELGGWSSFEMVKRYAHLSSEHLSDYSKNSRFGTNLAQLKKEVG